MKRISQIFALPGAIAAAAFAVVASAHGSDAATVSRAAVSAKIAYCQDCHGPHGQGYRGYFPIPRLAGQQIQYFKNQLQAFVQHTRTNNIMFHVAHVLSPAMQTALAERFRSFNPPPYGGGPRGLISAGREIFQVGLPNQNIPACAACHGPDAMGHDQIPRLRGQLYWYAVRELSDWGTERGRETLLHGPSATMLPVAHSLSRRDTEAVAAYVSSLR
jgi:cytochrome c553